MAKVSGPLFSVSASGDIGKVLNFTGGQSRPIVRAKIQRHKMPADERKYYRLLSVYRQALVSMLVFYDWRSLLYPGVGNWADYYRRFGWSSLGYPRGDVSADMLRAYIMARPRGATWKDKYESIAGRSSPLYNAVDFSYDLMPNWAELNGIVWRQPVRSVSIEVSINDGVVRDLPYYVLVSAAASFMEGVGFEYGLVPVTNAPQIETLGRIKPVIR